MALTERLALLITADTRGAVRGLGEVGKAADKNTKTIDKVGRGLTKFGVGAVGAASIAAAGLYKAGQAASDLEQSVGAVESVFGDASGIIEDFGKTASQTAGLSKRQVNEMASVVGAGLKGMGFSAEDAAKQVVDLEKRAADMAATFGGTTESAIESMASALRGERDPIEKFGVSIKQADVNARILALGLDTSSVAAEKNATAVATLDLIMTQTKDTQGAFAREADTAAGAQARMNAEIENLQAALGTAIAPIIGDIADKVGNLTSAFNNLSPEAQSAISQVAAWGTIAIGAAGGIALISGQVIKFRDRLKGGISALEKFGGALGATGGKGQKAGVGIAALATAIGVLAYAMEQGGSQFDHISDKLEKDFAQALDADGDAVGKFTRELIASKLATEGFADDLENAGVSSETLMAAVMGSESALATMRSQVEAAGGDVNGLSFYISSLGGALTGAQGELKTLNTLAGNTAEGTEGAGAAAADAAGGVDEFGGAAGNAAKETDKLVKETERLHNKMRGIFDPLFGVVDALNGQRDAQEDVKVAARNLADAQRKYGTDSSQAAMAARRHREALQALAKSSLDLDLAISQLSSDVAAGETSWNKAKGQIQRWADQGIITRGEAAKLRTELKRVHDRARELDGQNVNVGIKITGARQLKDLLDDLSTATAQGYISIAERKLIEGQASGGPVSGGTTYLVGEKGPELFTPGTSGYITPNHLLGGSWGGGGSTQIIINMPPGSDGQDVVDRIRAYERQNGTGWRN